MAKDFVIYKVHIHKTKQESSTSCSKACRNQSGGCTSGRPWSTIVSPKGCQPTNRRVGTSPLQGAFDEDFGGKV